MLLGPFCERINQTGVVVEAVISIGFLMMQKSGFTAVLKSINIYWTFFRVLSQFFKTLKKLFDWSKLEWTSIKFVSQSFGNVQSVIKKLHLDTLMNQNV